jgi:hypothetical protein
MPSSIIPAPPGYSVEFAELAARRFGPPSTRNVFAIGFADRGDLGQAAGITDLIDGIGPRVNYSPLFDSLATVLAEGAPLITYARVYGPAALPSTKAISGSISITAKSVGVWGDSLTYEITQPATGQRRIIIRENGVTVATSPVATTVQELVAWSDDNDIVTIGTGAALPAVVAATALAGGTDDRGNVTVADYQKALDKLDRRYGPGRFIAPGIDDPDVQQAILAHCKVNNRKARLDLASSVTKTQALDYASAIQADAPDLVEHGGTWAGWVYAKPIANQPERLVPWTAVQAGIESRVEGEQGIAVPGYGPTNGYATTVTRLFSEWSDADRSDLYAAGINVPTDDGTVVSSWGFCSLSLVQLDQDLHQQTIRMAYKFDAEAIARGMIAQPVDPSTLASYAGRLDGLSRAYQLARAIFGNEADPGYSIDVDSVNTSTTMAARELHALVRVRFGNSSDWADLLIPVVPINQSL